MKIYSCPECKARIFFENLSCLSCGAQLGYFPQTDQMQAVGTTATSSAEVTAVPHAGVVACANRTSVAVCNWLVGQSPSEPQLASPLCDSCRYTRKIPPLDAQDHQQAWRNIELAKRYLFYSLLQLQLPAPDRIQQPESGLAFDFLAQLPDAEKVLTGYDKGVITINVAEADDVVREQRRVSLQESYRTVLGHLRHEIGHFYWYQLVDSTAWLEPFRALFGDERADYSQALQNHYENINDGQWRTQFVSYYATSHAWEDWAETWAHYLHIIDALDTAAAWNASVDGTKHPVQRITLQTDEAQFRSVLIEQWLPLSQYLNASCRSLGEPDAYPFELPPPVVDKMAFIHAVVTAAR